MQSASGPSKLVRSNLKDKINSGNLNSIKSAINSINISQNINDNKNKLSLCDGIIKFVNFEPVDGWMV